MVEAASRPVAPHALARRRAGGYPFDVEPRQWLATQPWNNAFLMLILVWLEVGFAVVVLSAAIKGAPGELTEAARIDGASEWQAFRHVTLPEVRTTIVVVWTTVLITTWNVFDIVWVMTGGLYGTSVVAEDDHRALHLRQLRDELGLGGGPLPRRPAGDGRERAPLPIRGGGPLNRVVVAG
jgi:hypothetical protein